MRMSIPVMRHQTYWQWASCSQGAEPAASGGQFLAIRLLSLSAASALAVMVMIFCCQRAKPEGPGQRGNAYKLLQQPVHCYLTWGR